MAQDKKAPNLVTPYFRVAFANVFKPKPSMQPGGEPKFGLTAIFPAGTDLTAMIALAKKAQVEKWGEDPAKYPAKLRKPFRKGEERVGKYEGFEPGTVFVNITSKYLPGLVGPDKQPILDAQAFYSGCWARATVNAYAYAKAGNAGVAFGLINLQKVRDDAPFTKRVKAEDEFGAVEGAAAPAGAQDDSLFG
jgi:hypothetical protein